MVEEEVKKKPAVGATVPPPDQKADFFSQLMNTFERGVVSAEIDLGGLFAQGRGGGGSVVTMWGEASRIETGPAGVHEQIFRKMKEIANAFGGRFTVHAPMQADPAALTSIERARAAEIMKKSLEYAAKLNAPVITWHPIGSMGYYFVEPITGVRVPVSNPFLLAKDENELEELFKKFNVKDELLKQQIRKEWENWLRTFPLMFAEKYGAQAAQLFGSFADAAATINLIELAKKHGRDLKKIAEEFEHTLRFQLHPQVIEAFRNHLVEAARNPNYLDRLLMNEKDIKERWARIWPQIALMSLEQVDKYGRIPRLPPEAENWNLEKKREYLMKLAFEKAKEGWKAVIEGRRFGPFPDSIEQIKQNVIDTFEKLLSDPEVQKLLKKKRIVIALENLFPPVPEKGYMQGFPYFYTPEQMADIIKRLRAIAKAKGIPEDRISMTFDIGHAAASGIKPSEFIKKLRELGIKPEHVHIVGGPGYGHAHIAWGDWLDEVSRMDPEILKRLVDVGVINIEGGAGLHDIEVTLNAMWNEGIPLEALLAMAEAPDRIVPELARYAGFEPPYYWRDVAYNLARQGFPIRGLYSFSYPTLGAPLRMAFSSYSIPGLMGGGYSLGPGRTPAVWSSSQPFLYSAKRRLD